MSYFIASEYLLFAADHMGDIEPGTLDWIDSFDEQGVFYDVGAAHGQFSIYAAVKKNARVIAFEPEAQNFATLERNHYLNRRRILHATISLNIALSDSAELGPLYIYRYEAGLAMKILGRPVRRLETNEFDPAHVQIVMQERLDEVVSRYKLCLPNYVKIDVDGSEERVLQGATHTLSNNEVKSVLVEIVDPEGEGSKLISFLKDKGFILERKDRVENFDVMYNCIFRR